jgi:4-aminobutyrate aminotransferase-like enzyme
VFRIKPPMCITKEDAEMTAQVLEEAIAAVEATLSA